MIGDWFTPATATSSKGFYYHFNYPFNYPNTHISRDNIQWLWLAASLHCHNSYLNRIFSDSKECQDWIDSVNFVAAIYSAPVLPSAIGSQTKKFQRPLLPAGYTKLTMVISLTDYPSIQPICFFVASLQSCYLEFSITF